MIAADLANMSVSSNSTVKSGPPGDARHLGTLVCVVLKAKNLPNKRSIGKQDPYCVLQLGSEISKTKPDKRGGQHPQWDEQLHFEIHEDMEEMAGRKDPVAGPSSLSKGTIGPAAGSMGTASSATLKRKPPKSRMLRVACYADDTKEPEFIGEGSVDLSDTLRSGEFDEWVTIKAKDRYAGEVYLELTFYSSAAPPRKRSPLKPQVPANTTYGGAGTFSGEVDSDFEPRPRPPAKQPIPSAFMKQGSLPTTPSSNHVDSRLPQSVSHVKGMSNSSSSSPYYTPDAIPPSLRPSSSLAHVGSYTPPYAAQSIQRGRSPSVPAPPHDPADPRAFMTMPSQHHYQAPPAGAPAPPQRQASYHEYGRSDVSSFPQPYGSNYSSIPQSSSTVTVRPEHVRGDGGIDELIGGMSTMTVRPGMHQEPYGNANMFGAPRPSSSMSQQHGQPAFAASQSSNQVYAGPGEGYGRPQPQSIGHAGGSYGSQYRDQAGPPLPSPTPPPAPSSAPPVPAYQYPANGTSPHPIRSPAPLQHASSFPEPGTYPGHPNGGPPPPTHYQHDRHASQGATSPAPFPPPRALSPAVAGHAPPPPPPRGHTPGAYYALPQPPGASPAPSQYQQGPPPPAQHQQYAAPAHNGYTSPMPPSSTTFIQSPYARSMSPAPQSQGYPAAQPYGNAPYPPPQQYPSRPPDAYSGAPSSPLPPSHSDYVEEARYKPRPTSAASSSHPQSQQPQPPPSQYSASPAHYQQYQQQQGPPPTQQQPYYQPREQPQQPQQQHYAHLPPSQSQHYGQAPPPPPPAPYGAPQGYAGHDPHAPPPSMHQQQGSSHYYQSPYYQPPA